jgi:hydroxyacylglutathione hydrolase
MYRVLFHVLLKLPDETWVYCGHEYTKSNLKVRHHSTIILFFCNIVISLSFKFAMSIEPNNEALLAKWAWCQDKVVTIPSTIEQEKLYNPFLRVNEQSISMRVGKMDPVEVLQVLREMKDRFIS